MNLKATISPIGTLNARQSIGGKGGASDWEHLKNKPFETLGDDFTVDNGELQLAEGVVPAVSATSTLSTGTEIGSVTVDGVTTTFFAPEGGSVNIDNKSLIEVDGVVQEAVPVYTEQVVVPQIVDKVLGRDDYNLNDFIVALTNEEKDMIYGSESVGLNFSYNVDGVDTHLVINDWDYTDTQATYTDENNRTWRLCIEQDVPDPSFATWMVEARLVDGELPASVQSVDTEIDCGERTETVIHKLPSQYVDTTGLIDNKSIVLDSDGKISEAVPLWHEFDSQVVSVENAITLDRKQEKHAKFYTWLSIGADDEAAINNATISGYYEFYNSPQRVYFNWTGVNLNDSSAVYTDDAGRRWTINLDEQWSLYYYISFTCLDDEDFPTTENTAFNFTITLYNSYNQLCEQEYSNLDEWTYNFWRTTVYDSIDYPYIDNLYFKYFYGSGYDVSEVNVETGRVDVSQPIVITDTNNVEWTIVFSVPPGMEHGTQIDVSATNLPSNFMNFYEYQDTDGYMGNIMTAFKAQRVVDVYHQLPAEYVPIDGNTIQVNGQGKLYVNNSGGVSYEDLTGGVGTQIGTLRVDNADYYVYAPSGGGSADWDSIQNKPFNTVGEGLEVVDGALKEKVPVYTETVISVPAGFVITGWENTSHNLIDQDADFNPDNNTFSLDTSASAYTVTAKVNGNVYTGYWTANTGDGHTYGGYTWNAGTSTYEFYLEDQGNNAWHTHVYFNGVVMDSMDWLVITPVNSGDPLESLTGVTGTNCYWSNGQQGGTVVHQLPAQYVPIDNDTIINDNGVLKAAGGSGSVEIDNKSIIKNQDDELQEAIPVYSEQVSSTHNSIQNWSVKSGYYHYARQNAYAGYLRGALRNTGDAFYTVIVNFDYNNQTYQASGVCNNIGLGSSNNFVSGDILDYFTGFGVATSNSGQGQLYCPNWNKSAGISVNWAVVKEAEYNATYESTDLEVVETVYHQIPYEYIPAEQSILSKNSNGRLSLAKNIINDMVRFGNGFMRGGYTDNKYPELMGINVSFSSNNNSIISNNTSGARTAIGGAFGAANGPGNTSQGSIDFTRRSDKYILESKNNTIFNSIGDNSYAWIGFYYNYVGTNNPDYPSGCPFYIVGRIRLGDITNDKADFDIEGCEAILDSAVYDSSISKYVFTFKQDIYPSIRMEYFYLTIAQYKPINDKYQKVNSFFLPLDNSTIVRDSDGNIKTAIPAPPTTDGTYTLQVVVSNGEPAYSWI